MQSPKGDATWLRSATNLRMTRGTGFSTFCFLGVPKRAAPTSFLKAHRLWTASARACSSAMRSSLLLLSKSAPKSQSIAFPKFPF
jgi:hypothetical protein